MLTKGLERLTTDIDAILSYLASTVSGRTYSTKAVTQGGAGYFLIGGDGSKTVRIRSGLFVGDVLGSIIFTYSDANDGTGNAVNVSGVIPVAANGGFRLEPDNGIGHFVIPAGKYFGFTSVTAKVFGWTNLSLE